MSTPVLHDAFAHHIWATQRLLEACAALEPRQLDTTVPGTYGSIRDTLRHLVGADAGYLFTLTGGRMPEVEEDQLDLAGMRAVIDRNGPEWAAIVAADIDPDADIVRRRDDGTNSHAPLGIRLAQVLHHGTDHRSQICTALTSLGIQPPEIDVWDFAEQDGRLSVTPAAT